MERQEVVRFSDEISEEGWRINIDAMTLLT
jgi:hypothetical protein